MRRAVEDGITLVVLAAVFGAPVLALLFVAAEVATTLAEAAGLPLALPRPRAAEVATLVGAAGVAMAGVRRVRADAPRAA